MCGGAPQGTQRTLSAGPWKSSLGKGTAQRCKREETAASAGDPGSSAGEGLGEGLAGGCCRARSRLVFKLREQEWRTGQERKRWQAGGGGSIGPAKWMGYGKVRNRARRWDMGTGKREEPTDMQCSAFSAKMVICQNLILCHATRGGGGSAVGVC